MEATSHQVIIESVDATGNGIARIDGKTVFVSGAMPDETVKIEIYKRKPKFDLAKLVEIITPSKDRVTPECPSFGVCGGCSVQHIEFKAQVANKEKVLFDNLKHIGKVNAESILPSLYGEPWGYRHRARLSVRYVFKKGGVLVGFREKGAALVTDMTECKVLPKHISALIPGLRELINKLSIKDKVPQIEVAVGDNVSVLVLRIMESLKNNDEKLIRQFVDSVNQVSSENSVELTQPELQIWLQPDGQDSMYPFYPATTTKQLSYTLPKFNLFMPFLPSEFTQVNPSINHAMVDNAITLLDIKASDKIADFFCGIGNFTLPIATKAASVLGIEGSERLVLRATENALHNKLAANTSFIKMDLFTIDAGNLSNLGKFDKWLIDPPRDGAIQLIEAITPEIAPGRIVYVSCNPGTLARDANILVNTLGYTLTKAGVMNMFPHTSHIESIAVFDRK